jgi:hypothetical protein
LIWFRNPHWQTYKIENITLHDIELNDFEWWQRLTFLSKGLAIAVETFYHIYTLWEGPENFRHGCRWKNRCQIQLILV